MCITMSRSKEILLEVLGLYKSMPCLWDKTHMDYKNKYSREEAYRILLEVYKSCDTNATVKVMTKKIQNLRTSYFKELKKVRRAEKKGESYIPSLFYYEALRFLGDVKNNAPYEILEDTDTEEKGDGAACSSSDDNDQDSDIEESSRSIPQTKRMSKLKSAPINMAREIMKDEEWEILGKSIGLQLRGLNSKQLTITQKIISDAIYYAKIGRLSERSFIALDNSDEEDFAEAPSTSYFVSLPKTKHPGHSVSSSTSRSYLNSDRSTRHRFSRNISRTRSRDPLVKTEPGNMKRKSDSLHDADEIEYLEIDHDGFMENDS